MSTTTDVRAAYRALVATAVEHSVNEARAWVLITLPVDVNDREGAQAFWIVTPGPEGQIMPTVLGEMCLGSDPGMAQAMLRCLKLGIEVGYAHTRGTS